MQLMMMSLAIIISIGTAVMIDPSEGGSKIIDSSYGWQYFNLYHPSSPQIYFNKDTHAYPKYEFEYAVSDPLTGDHKHHHETRDGDKVRGEYSLIEPDGSLRNVQYNADHYSGFNAIVSTSVQKHGDQAISTFGLSRNFPPLAHGVKINHFFPNKDYMSPHYVSLNENLKNKPVKEYVEEVIQHNNASYINREMESINMEPKNEEHSSMVPISNEIGKIMKTTESPAVETMPIVITDTDYDTSENSEENNQHKHISQNSDEISGKGEKDSKNENQQLHKTDNSLDSEVASSYFPRIHYIRI